MRVWATVLWASSSHKDTGRHLGHWSLSTINMRTRMSPSVFCWACVLLLVESVLGIVLPYVDTHIDHQQPQLEWIVEPIVAETSVNSRVKRQLSNYGNDPGAQVINDIFQIPILTLTAVSNLFRSTRASRNHRRRNSNNNNDDSLTNNDSYDTGSNTNYNNKNKYTNNYNNKYSTTGYNDRYTSHSKPNVYYTTDSNGQNNGYSDTISRPNRYSSVNGYNRPNNYFYQNSNEHLYSRQTPAAAIARLSVARDGSSFKI